MNIGAFFQRLLSGGQRHAFNRLVNDALHQLDAAAESGVTIPPSVIAVLLATRDAARAGAIDNQLEANFYGAFAELAACLRDDTPETFGAALRDATEMLRFASESGTVIDAAIATPIIAADSAFERNAADDTIRIAFYMAFAALGSKLGGVTADSIRSCSSPDTKRALNIQWMCAIGLTVLIVVFSVGMFVTGTMSKRITDTIDVANASAAKLATPAGGSESDNALLGLSPDELCAKASPQPNGQQDKSRKTTLADVQEFQGFATAIRDLQSAALKLNQFGLYPECDPFGLPAGKCEGAPTTAKELEKYTFRRMQINPAFANYQADVLCKIITYQTVRNFAANVNANYSAAVGAILSFFLPIAYALLGAYAFPLRLFGETVRKRTYHPSFADSSRLITAVIAGAIVGLFNPAKGLELSPLATAFLVGYGVELFFKFLDTLLNSFGSNK